MLTRWDPFAEIARMQNEMTRGFGAEGGRGPHAPAVDIKEEKEAYVVRAELPGVKKEDVHIDVENNVLTLRGERRLAEEESREGYQRIERWYGAFARSFALPSTVDSERIEAKLEDGVLSVRLPKRNELRSRRIEVRS